MNSSTQILRFADRTAPLSFGCAEYDRNRDELAVDAVYKHIGKHCGTISRPDSAIERSLEKSLSFVFERVWEMEFQFEVVKTASDIGGGKYG